MSKRAILAATAIVVGSFNPVFSTAAWAAVTIIDPTPTADAPTAETLAAMEDQCDALAAAHGVNWDGELDESSIVASYVSGPTESGTHSIDDAIEGTLEGAGTFTPGSVSILGEPFRIGGSVNMFGVLQSTGGHYSASEYDFLGEFDTTFSYAFNCTMTESVHHAAVGHYVISPDAHGGEEEAILQECNAYNALGENDPLPGFWGNSPQGNCVFEITTPEGDTDEPRDDEAGTPIEQTQTDTLLAHEDAGEGFDIGETVLIGQAVICISPSKTGPKGVPGTWTKQNGYTGSNCTTTYFNTAPWGAGSQDSNGTYISVPLA
jgi:hypothetical protein